jgi:hypothetical protein
MKANKFIKGYNMVTNVKMQVTPDLSRRIQEIVFANGGSWCSKSKKIDYIEKEYLYLTDNSLSFGNVYSIFSMDRKKEISPYDFIASQGQQEWLPKFGEKVEVSDKANFKHTGTGIFKGYVPDSDYPFYTNSGAFRYCKPIEQTKTITIDGIDIEVSEESFEAFKAQFCK